MNLDKPFYPRHEIAKLLNISYLRKIEKILKEYNLTPVYKDTHNVEYYKKEDANMLINKQQELYNHFVIHYIDYHKGLEIGAVKHDFRHAESTTLPILIRINNFYNKRVVYPRDIILSRIKKRTLLAKNQLYTTIEVANLFQLHPSNVKKFMGSYNISPIYEMDKLWGKEGVDSLLKRRTETYNYYTENYLTLNEASEILNVKINKVSGLVRRNKIPSESLPQLASFGKFKWCRIIIKKIILDEYIINIEKKKGYKLQQLSTKSKINSHKKQTSKKSNINPKIQQGNKKKSINLSHVVRGKHNTLAFKELNQHRKIFLKTLLKLLKSQIQQNFYTLSEARNILELSPRNFKIVMEERNILPTISDTNLVLFQKTDIINLKKEQDELYKLYNEAYITFKDLRKFNLGYLTAKKIGGVHLPYLVCIKKFRRSKTVLFYKKAQVQQHIKDIEKKKNFFKDLSFPVDLFEQLISERKVSFSKQASLTKKYWNSYVQQTLLKTRCNDKGLKKLINRFVALTTLLANITNEKELFSYSANELNLLIFNNKIYQEYRMSLFTFLHFINNSSPFTLIDIPKISNPNKEKLKKIKTKKETYTASQFLNLMNFLAQTTNHKLKAMKDIESISFNIRKYKKYDSVWLYALLHMNNGWRSSDFTSKIPRIDLPPNVKSFTDIKNRDFNMQEAKQIIVQLQSKLYGTVHSKNRKSLYFFCSEELTIPIATALVLCELRTRLTTPLNDYLIDFMNEDNEMLPGSHDAFFSSFENGYRFSSLKMNRTYIGLMTDVIRKKTNRNPLEITKHIRNHSSIETTNIYIDIPNEHVNYISKQLFDTGYFGYTYELLSSIILGISEEDYSKKTDNIKSLQDIFGDIYKVENMSGYINLIENERLNVKSYFSGLPQEALVEKLNLINLEQLPSKEMYYQCLYGKCIFLERECNKCPFAIPHFYALSTIGDRILARIKEYKRMIHSDLKGEKIRISNLLFSDLLLLKEAKQKFGTDVLAAFLKIDYETLRTEISSLPSPYDYITIQRR
ncbi:helix-turn-helix domain-containing protein [Priestia megaterium]|uniref:helix-turn-helix domain-containing protein n=2 Tax=Priestia megaterium TaxID=1404 RepID=UPI00249B6FA2|nr:helix-turn-helix domain-containing protein [Priestia megaterium]MDI3091474.1 helix-turn-helix domain-containing protein [Priestia megaterium]